MTTDAVGGVWVHATGLAQALCRRGHAVTLVALGPAPRADQCETLRDVPGLRIEVTDLRLEWMDPEGLDLARALATLTAIERRVRPDIVHLNGYREALAEWRAPVMIGAHSCVGSWWRACRPERAIEAQWRPYLANLHAGLAAADLWAAPTAAFRAEIQQLYNPPRPGRVIRNGLDVRWTATAKQPLILAAGRMWDEAKNMSALAAVAPESPWPIRIAGALWSAGAAVRPPPGVACLGELPREALLAEMARAAVFVAPALYEPFGLTVLEAAASGCALVLADIPSFRELWDGAALFVDPRDQDALRAAFDRLARDDARLHQLQHRAARRARRYTLKTMTDAYSDAYEALAGSTTRNKIPMQSQPVEGTP